MAGLRLELRPGTDWARGGGARSQGPGGAGGRRRRKRPWVVLGGEPQRSCLSSSQPQSANEKRAQGAPQPMETCRLPRHCHWKHRWRPGQALFLGGRFPRSLGSVCTKDRNTQSEFIYPVSRLRAPAVCKARAVAGGGGQGRKGGGPRDGNALPVLSGAEAAEGLLRLLHVPRRFYY